MARLPRFARIFIIVASIVIAVAVLWQLGHKSPPGPAEAALVGTWSDTHVVIDLRPDGLYWTVTADTAGGVSPAECGRWHVSSGTLQMRSTWQTAPSGPVRLAQPGFHLGTWAGDPPATLSLLTAKPQLGAQRTTDAETRVLHRAPSPAAEAMMPDARHAFEKSCGMHLPD